MATTLDPPRPPADIDETDETDETAAAPSAPASASAGPGRLVGIDIARAVALLGMFTQHVSLDGEGGQSTGWVAWVFTEAAGRASVLFFVLSGVSLSVIAARGSASAAPTVLYRRGFLLLTGGLLLTASIWPASILQHYGIAFLAAPLLLRLGWRGLTAVTAAGLVGGPVLLLFARNWTSEVVGVADGQAGQWVLGTAWELAVSGLYPMVLWIGFFTAGMLIGRLDLGDRRTLVRLTVASLVAVLVVGFTAARLTDRYGSPDVGFDGGSGSGSGSLIDGGGLAAGDPFDDDSLWEELPDGSFEFVGTDEQLAELEAAGAFDGSVDDGFDEFGSGGSGAFLPVDDVDIPPDGRALYEVAGHSGGMGWTLLTGALASGAMALALLLPALVQRGLAPLAWMGSMSLTAYVVHIVLVTDVAGPHIEDGDWSILTRELAFAGLLVTMTAVCALFHLVLRTGPLEWLLKQFTLGQRKTKPS